LAKDGLADVAQPLGASSQYSLSAANISEVYIKKTASAFRQDGFYHLILKFIS